MSKKIITIWVVSCILTGVAASGFTEKRLNNKHELENLDYQMVKRERDFLSYLKKTYEKHSDSCVKTHSLCDMIVNPHGKLSLPNMTETYYPRWHKLGYVYVGNILRGNEVTERIDKAAKNKMGRKIWVDGSNKTVVKFKIDVGLNGRWRNGKEDNVSFPTFVKVE